MTLVELIIVATVMGLITVVIAAAFTTVLRITPQTEYRIDDARSTRGLQTWLARDIASTPASVYASGVGYVDSSAALPAAACTTAGTHVLFMAWKDGSTTYRAQYTIEGDATSGYEVIRTVCGGDSAVISLTGDVSNAACASKPRSDLSIVMTPDGETATVNLCFVSTQTDGLTGGSSQQEITMSVVSRNGDF